MAFLPATAKFPSRGARIGAAAGLRRVKLTISSGDCDDASGKLMTIDKSELVPMSCVGDWWSCEIKMEAGAKRSTILVNASNR
jgi:hypothetical protein